MGTVKKIKTNKQWLQSRHQVAYPSEEQSNLVQGLASKMKFQDSTWHPWALQLKKLCKRELTSIKGSSVFTKPCRNLMYRWRLKTCWKRFKKRNKTCCRVLKVIRSFSLLRCRGAMCHLMMSRFIRVMTCKLISRLLSCQQEIKCR